MPKTRAGKILKFSLLAVAAALAAGLVYCLVVPGISRLKKDAPASTAFMRYRLAMAKKAGKNLAISRRWVPLSSISPYLVQAVVISEDDKFWTHHGFDLQAIKIAIEKDIKTRTLMFGGSTITQQLAKNLFLSPSKNPLRKLREIVLTWRMESISAWRGWTSSTIRAPAREPKMKRPTVSANARSRNLI